MAAEIAISRPDALPNFISIQPMSETHIPNETGKLASLDDDESAMFSKAASAVGNKTERRRQARVPRMSSARALIERSPNASAGPVINSDGFPIEGRLRRPSSTSSLTKMATGSQQLTSPVVRSNKTRSKSSVQSSNRNTQFTLEDTASTLTDLFEDKLMHADDQSSGFASPKELRAASTRRSLSYFSPTTPEKMRLAVDGISNFFHSPKADKMLSYAPFTGEETSQSPTEAMSSESDNSKNNLPTSTELVVKEQVTSPVKRPSLPRSTSYRSNPRLSSPPKQPRTQPSRNVQGSPHDAEGDASTPKKSSSPMKKIAKALRSPTKVFSPEYLSRSPSCRQVEDDSEPSTTNEPSNKLFSTPRRGSRSGKPKRHHSLSRMEMQPSLRSLTQLELQRNGETFTSKSQKSPRKLFRNSSGGKPRRHKSLGRMDGPPAHHQGQQQRSVRSISVTEHNPNSPEIETLPKLTENPSTQGTCTRNRSGRPGRKPGGERMTRQNSLSGRRRSSTAFARSQSKRSLKSGERRSDDDEIVVGGEVFEVKPQRSQSMFERASSAQQMEVEEEEKQSRPPSVINIDISSPDLDMNDEQRPNRISSLTDRPKLARKLNEPTRSLSLRSMGDRPKSTRRLQVERNDQPRPNRKSLTERAKSARRLSSVERNDPTRSQSTVSLNERSKSARRLSVENETLRKTASYGKSEIADEQQQQLRRKSVGNAPGETGRQKGTYARDGSFRRRQTSVGSFKSPRDLSKISHVGDKSDVDVQTPATRRLRRAMLQRDLIEGLLLVDPDATESSELFSERGGIDEVDIGSPRLSPSDADNMQQDEDSTKAATRVSPSDQHEMDDFVESRLTKNEGKVSLLQKTLNRAVVGNSARRLEDQ